MYPKIYISLIKERRWLGEMVNRINYKQVALYFSVPWCLLYLGAVGIRKLDYINEYIIPVKTLILNTIAPALFLFLIGLLLYKISQRKARLTFKTGFFIVAALAILDQAIKGILITAIGYEYFPIVEEFIYYRGSLHSGHFLDEEGKIMTQNFYAIIIFIIPLLHITEYRKSKYKGNNDEYRLDMASIPWVFGYATMLCFYMDRLLRGGSFNYISLHRFIIFDLKDIYAVIAMLTFLTFLQPSAGEQNRNKLNKEQRDFFDLKYFAYEYGNIKRWLGERRLKRKNGDKHE